MLKVVMEFIVLIILTCVCSFILTTLNLTIFHFGKEVIGFLHFVLGLFIGFIMAQRNK